MNNIEDLSKIPINVLIELRDISKEKRRVVQNQNFAQAVIFRDRERRIYFEYNISKVDLDNLEYIIEQIRNHKINKILNEEEGNN